MTARAVRRTVCSKHMQKTDGCAPSWLSADMATALAATAPPLTAADVTHAAEGLAERSTPLQAINVLLRCGGNLLQAQQLVEALRALRDSPA